MLQTATYEYIPISFKVTRTEHSVKFLKNVNSLIIPTALTSFSELRIRGGIEDNLKIIFLMSHQNICCDPS